MKKILMALLAFVLSAALLASCSVLSGDGGSSDGTDQNANGNDQSQGSDQNQNAGNNSSDKNGWQKGDAVYYRGDKDISLSSLKDRFASDTFLGFYTEGGGEGDRLFILGEYDSQLSRKAYSILENNYTDDPSNAAFVIYTDGSSVAIAYNGYVARYAALDYFFTEFESIKFSEAGIVASRELNAEEYVNEAREIYRKEVLKRLEGNLSAEAVAELGKMYSLYDERIYIWLANLWDPSTGGFYYSQSARNTQGFLPDLESTAQALLFIADSGMISEYDDKYAAALPKEMLKSIVSFVKSCQDPNDGYFYHKQWGKTENDNRLGRDLSWATRILSALGEKPYWDTKNGYEGELGAPGSGAVPTASLSLGVRAAVSYVVPVAADYLNDLELFNKHLEEDFDWEHESYRAGNSIESDLGQIQRKGSDFTEALITFLNSKQKENGLWEDEVSYDSVNGLMKISAVYTSLKEVIPRADKAMESARKMLSSTDRPSHVCSVYNPWEAVANILVSIEKTAGAAEAAKLKAEFRAEAEELIKITAEKLAIFKKNDGGFSYYIKYSAASSQGSSVALEKSEESDVNATMICVNSTIRAMFDVFGLTEAERYCPADFALFSDTLSDMGTIIKDEIREAEVITFDAYDSEWGEEEGGISMTPDDFAISVVGDYDTDSFGKYKWFSSSVVKNPDPDSKKGDLVLYSKANVMVGEEKPMADKPFSTRFLIPNAGLEILGNCYVYDADMYFVSGYGKTSSSGKSTSDPIIQLFFMSDALPCSSVNFSVYTEGGVDYVKIGENYAGLDGKESNLAGKIPMDEWVNIRIEYYKNYTISDSGTAIYKPAMKIFVNGKFAGDCDATITGANAKGVIEYYDRKVDRVSISYYRYLASEIYFNNVLVERCRKEYTVEENPDAIIDPPLPDEEMRESYGFEDGLLNTSNVVNKVRVVDFGVSKYINATEGQTYNRFISYSITDDPKNAANHVLKVTTLKSEEFDKPSRTEVNLHNSAADGADYTFSGKFYYSAEDIGVNGDLTQIFFLNSLEGQAYSIRISAKNTGGVFTLSLIENNTASGDTGTGKTIHEGIPCDKWFELEVVLHKTGVAETTGADIYLNGHPILKDTSYKAAALAQSPIVKVAIVHQKTNRSTLYLDDLSFTKSGKIEEAVESDERTASFTDGFNTKYVHSYSYSGSNKLDVTDIDPIAMETIYTKFYLITDPKDAANQVLRAVNKNGGTNAGYTEVKVSNENPSGDCYTFETKMYIETASSGYNLTQLKFIDKENATAYSVFISIDSATSNLKISTTGSGIYPAAGTNLLDGSNIAVKKTVWFEIRFELYHKGEDATKSNTYVKLYVNDILAYDGIGYGALGAEIDHAEIVHCKTAKSSAVYFDDISLTRTDKAYSKDSE